MKTLRFYMPGILLILIALVIVMVPEVLIAFTAALISMIGIGLLRLGHIIKTSGYDTFDSDDWFRRDDFLRWQFERVPEYRRWNRYS